MTGLFNYGKAAISMYFLGKLGKDTLAGGSLAIGVANITGYSIIFGLAKGMEGITSQATGARKWNVVGETLQCTIMVLILTCIPISLLWLIIEPILVLFRQDPSMSYIAATYLAFSIPDLLCQCLICPLKIFMRTQGVTLPLMYGAGLTLLIHAFTNCVVFHTYGLGIQGIALIGAFTNLNLILVLVLYLWFSGACSQTWQGWSWQNFNHWRSIIDQGGPSCFSVCSEWWWYEFLVLVSGGLANAADAVASYGIIIQATSLMYNFPNALSLAVITRVGNELGANRPDKAKTSAFTALLCSFITAFVAMSWMMTMSDVWGQVFTQDEEVLSLLAKTLPIVGLCELGNCPQTTLCGMLTASARPLLGAHIYFLSFYAVGLPVSLMLCFCLEFGLSGLFFGLLIAQTVCATCMIIALAQTDWEDEAFNARLLLSGIGQRYGESD